MIMTGCTYLYLLFLVNHINSISYSGLEWFSFLSFYVKFCRNEDAKVEEIKV